MLMLQIAAQSADFESWCSFLIAFALCCSKQMCSTTTICSLCIIINVLIVALSEVICLPSLESEFMKICPSVYYISIIISRMKTKNT
uniref:Uncharacterized protein n=1 Tax=Populus trichocarpa TaxID=3694 RepID=A0A3N7GU03_POPTR